MNQLLLCQNCRQEFNNQSNVPKILPCSHTVCKSCIEIESNHFLDDVFYVCLVCNTRTVITDTSDLPDNKLLLDHCASNKQKFDSVFNLEQLTLNKHFDQVINNIDLKTEFLILQLNNLRDSLIDRVKILRDNSVDELELLKEQESMIQNKSFLDLEMINHYNILQANLYNIKKNLCCFEEVNLNENCLLGYVMTKSRNKNYFKIKNLTINFKSNLTFKIDLNSEDNLTEGSIRQYLLPLSRNKIVKIYFSLKRDLTLELFDLKGKSIKRVKALDNMSSFPIISTYDKFICISATGNVPNQDTFFSRFSHLILFDWDLNCVKKTQKSSMIESIFMNEHNLLLTYSHRNVDICEILNYDLESIGSFGQQSNSEEGFYLEKNDNIYRSSQRELSFPKIFGFTDQHIYLFNKFQMIKMTRQDGSIEKLIELNGEPCNFILDKQKNIIKISGLSKKISFFNYEENVTITSSFSYNFDEVFVSSDDYLVFCDSNKDYVNFI